MSYPGDRQMGADTLAQDRTIRALMALAEDLTVEHDEDSLLRTTLEHVVVTLALGGGLTFRLGKDGSLCEAAACGRVSPDAAATRAVAQQALERLRPGMRELPEGGWLAATPLWTQDRPLGVLALHDDRADGQAPDVELLVALGKQIGTGLENARLYAELQAQTRREQTINRIIAALTSSMDLKLVLPAFASEVLPLCPFDRLACAFVNDSGDYIEVYAHPEGASWGLGDVIPVVGSGPGSVVLNDTQVSQPDLLRSHRFIEDMRLLEEGIRSYVLLPLHSRGRCIGVLALGARQPAAFGEEACQRLQGLLDSVSLALENLRLFQKARELSITDEITPLYNFRFFHQILERELKLVDRYGSMLSLIFIDLDRFKPINDQYGHLRGSRTLREVGFLLRTAVRETDYPARYGGDEFVVILPQTDHEAADVAAEKLRRLIEEHVFLQEEGIDARLGCSAGVATYPQEAKTKEALIRLADERMYADKLARKQER